MQYRLGALLLAVVVATAAVTVSASAEEAPAPSDGQQPATVVEAMRLAHPPPLAPNDANDAWVWQPGVPPPPGFSTLRPKAGRMLAIVGMSLLGAGYAAMAVPGAFFTLFCAASANSDGVQCDPGQPAPMLIPVVGPFVFVATMGPSNLGTTATALILADGAMQLGGAITLVAGLVVNANARPTFVRSADATVSRIRLGPMVLAGARGLMLGGSF